MEGPQIGAETGDGKQLLQPFLHHFTIEGRTVLTTHTHFYLHMPGVWLRFLPGLQFRKTTFPLNPGA